MSGLIGWSGFSGAGELSAVAEDMSSSLTQFSGDTLTSEMSDVAFVGVVGDIATSGLFADERYMVAICGDAYFVDVELLSRVEERGLPSTIAYGFNRHHESILNKLHGSFSLALIDKEKQYTLLAVDRLGCMQLAFSVRSGQFVFGSTLDAIKAHPGIQAQIDPQSIYNYIYAHVVPSPDTIYQGIERLLPGQYVTSNNSQIETGFYWVPSYSEDNSKAQSELKDELFERLYSSTKRFAEIEDVGVFLSGGVDSSTITGVLSKVHQGQVRAYSIGFEADGYDELEFARITAKHFGVELNEYYLTPYDIIDAIPKIAAIFDQPFGNASAVPTYVCAKLAREDGIKTLLAGDGGDELFAGNARYAKQKLFEYYGNVPSVLRKGLIEPVLFNLPGIDYVLPLRKMKSYVRQARMDMPHRMESTNLLHYLGEREMFSDDFFAQVDLNRPKEIVADAYRHAQTENLLNNMLALDLKVTLADNDLPKVNRMCQLAGVDVRYPLLSDEMMEFSMRLPSSLKLKGQHLRYFFKESMRGFLAEETLSKSKQGFGLPFGVWAQTNKPLRELVGDTLNDLKRRNIVKGQFIDQLLSVRMQEHAAFYGVMVWVLVMLEFWYKQHVD